MTALACDFGGTSIKLGVARDGTVLASAAIPTRARIPLAEQLDAIAGELRRLCEQTGVRLADCDGIGVSFPSVIDPAAPRIVDHFEKFPDAIGFDLGAWARRAFDLPLALENDARMALLGEWRHGAGRGCDDVAIMTLGTGIGTSAVIGGRLVRGVHGLAGILGGHLTVRVDGGDCPCGNIGCSELDASTWALPGLARTAPGFGASALAAEAVIDYAAVVRHARAGDALARTLFERSVRVWGATAVNLIHAYDPTRLILGGGLMGSADVIVPAVAAHVHRHAHTPWGKVEVVAAALGGRAALLACEDLVKERCR